MPDDTKIINLGEAGATRQSRPKPPLGAIVLALLVLGGAGLFCWWLIGKARVLSGSIEAGVIAGILTILACTIMVVLAIHRTSPSRATQLRCRGEAYSALLTTALGTGTRSISLKQWRRVRVGILLWGGRSVLEEFSELEQGGVPLDLDDLQSAARFASLISAMRKDLGQSGFTWPGMDDEQEEPEEED
jgi:hypothetical protein